MSKMMYIEIYEFTVPRAVERSGPFLWRRDSLYTVNRTLSSSKAAYEERCRRRLAAQRRGELRESSGQSSGRRDRSVNNNHISRDNANRSQVAATSRSSLNPTASEFTASGLRDTRSGM